MKEFRVKIIYGDFSTGTIVRSGNKTEAIKSFIGGLRFNSDCVDGFSVTCEEIPQKSAFQEWDGGVCTNDKQYNVRREDRKEGWNAGIDAAIKILTDPKIRSIMTKHFLDIKEP